MYTYIPSFLNLPLPMPPLPTPPLPRSPQSPEWAPCAVQQAPASSLPPQATPSPSPCHPSPLSPPSPTPPGVTPEPQAELRALRSSSHQLSALHMVAYMGQRYSPNCYVLNTLWPRPHLMTTHVYVHRAPNLNNAWNNGGSTIWIKAWRIYGICYLP